MTSNALDTVFLPARLQVMSNLLGVPIIPNPCSNGGGGVAGSGSVGGGSNGFGGSATAGTFSMGGGFSTGGATSAGGDGGMTAPPPVPEAAPVIVIELPSVDEPVSQMQEEEQEIRQEYGDVTLSGKSAQSTH